MARQIINAGETGLVVRNKLNGNFQEMYDQNPSIKLYDFWLESKFPTSINPSPPFSLGAISTGSFSNSGGLAAAADGFWNNSILLNNSATANSGVRAQLSHGIHRLGAMAQKFKKVFRLSVLANTTIRAGYHNSTTSVAPTVGAYFDIIAGLVTGRTIKTGGNAATPSTYQLAINTNYGFDITVNATSTLVTFTIFNPVTDEVLWTDSISTFIPANLTADAVNVGLVATSSGTVAGNLGVLFMMGFGTIPGYIRAYGNTGL